MDELISRQDAIEAFADVFNGTENTIMELTFNECKSVIESLPSAQPEQRWIPCSERLPIIKNNIGTRVLITTSWGLVKEAHYCVDHWEVDGISYKLTSATAWMPLPEPWKGEDDGEGKDSDLSS